MKILENGFYYHYKHNPNGAINNYSYEVISVGTHTETQEKFVIYRPLYQTETRGGANYWLRPLQMFIEDVTKDGKTFPRFQRITNQDLISKLTKIKDAMYF